MAQKKQNKKKIPAKDNVRSPTSKRPGIDIGPIVNQPSKPDQPDIQDAQPNFNTNVETPHESREDYQPNNRPQP